MKRNNAMKNFKSIAAAALLGASLPAAITQACAPNSWIGGAGGKVTSASHQLTASIGQALAGSGISSRTSVVYAGFMQAGPYGAGGTIPVEPPLPPAQIPTTTIDNAVIYPNPARPGRGDTVMHVVNLPVGTTVKIYTFAGELVRTIETDGTGGLSWDMKNRDGDPVSSGVYFGFIKNGNSKKLLKLAVER